MHKNLLPNFAQNTCRRESKGSRNDNNFSLAKRRKCKREKFRWEKSAIADLSGSCGDARTHAKNLPRACVRAGVCCAFSLQPELQKARPDLSRCPLTDFYATIIR